MKKSALLAVSALSLGLVGLSTFVPVANAAANYNNTGSNATGDATITLKVDAAFGIGTEEVGNAGTIEWSADAADVDLGTISVNAKTGDVKKDIFYINNTGKGAKLSLADKDASTDLVSGTNKIETGETVKAGTSNWGVKLNDATTYSAMPADTGTALSLGDSLSGKGQVKATYAASTNATQAAGTYTDVVTYTFTQDAQ